MTCVPAKAHDQPSPFALTNVAPGGSVSVTVASASALGPLLWTTTAYVSAPPAGTGSGVALSVLARSPLSSTVCSYRVRLFAVIRSAVIAATRPSTKIGPPVAGVRPFHCNGYAFVTSWGSVQVDPPHDQPTAPK